MRPVIWRRLGPTMLCFSPSTPDGRKNPGNAFIEKECASSWPMILRESMRRSGLQNLNGSCLQFLPGTTHTRANGPEIKELGHDHRTRNRRQNAEPRGDPRHGVGGRKLLAD